ncbi:MAG: DUF3368 domain-containing protein [Thermoguttaceae bacterium]
MIVIADSSPIIALINIGHIHLLPALFEEVIVPPQVAAELERCRRPPSLRDFLAASPSWFRQRKPTSVEAIAALHDGESAAISLARELGTDLLLIDETRGRKAATERGVAVTGTVGILELAADKGLLDLAAAFTALKTTDFWISPALLDARLRLHSARRKPR